MKFWEFRLYCLEVALADFGLDRRRSESVRASGNFVFFVRSITHDFTDFQSAKFHEICTQDVDLRDDESFRKTFVKICPQGDFFSKKGKFWATVFNDFGLQAAISPK